LERYAVDQKAEAAADKPTLRQQGEHIRAIQEYQRLMDEYSQHRGSRLAQTRSLNHHHSIEMKTMSMSYRNWNGLCERCGSRA